MKALFVVSEEGFWAEECFEPMQTLQENGFDIVVATPSGAEPVVDESSMDPDEVGAETARKYGGMNAAEERMTDPIPVTDALDIDYDVAVFPGGHGTMFDVNHDAHAQQLLADAVQDKTALVICHAVGLLGFARDANGAFVVGGRAVTGFPNDWEDDIVDEDELLPNGIKLPYRVQDAVERAGGDWDAELDQDTSVQVDGNLITARGPASSQEAVETLLNELDGTAEAAE
jgi:putative intracellular protease/amidase